MRSHVVLRALPPGLQKKLEYTSEFVTVDLAQFLRQV